MRSFRIYQENSFWYSVRSEVSGNRGSRFEAPEGHLNVSSIFSFWIINYPNPYLYLMDAFDPIFRYVERFIWLDADEKRYFASVLRRVEVKRKQFIVQPEFVCKYLSYIEQGAMRAYLPGSRGQEHTILLSVDDWWISDYYSYIHQVPATLFVQALEDSTLIQIDYASEQRLLEAVPKFERFFRIITQRALAHLQHRMLTNLSMSAEERYEAFLLKYPQVAARVPQYMLASYLGFSSEFLSKIRNRQAHRS